MASDRARDVVRYITAIEETGCYRTIWQQSRRPPFGFFGWLRLTADGRRALYPDLFDPIENARAAARYVAARYGPTGWLKPTPKLPSSRSPH